MAVSGAFTCGVLGERPLPDAEDDQVAEDPELAHGRGDHQQVGGGSSTGGEVVDERHEHVAHPTGDEDPAERAG